MKPIVVPTTDVNSERGLLVAWQAENRAWIERGSEIAHVETSKALIEVETPDSGFLLHVASADETVLLSAPIGYVFPDQASLERYVLELQQEPSAAADGGTVRATQQAQKRAAELGVDLTRLDTSRLITLKDVETAAAVTPDYSGMATPLESAAGRQRLLLIGAALGATQVLDILSKSLTQQAVAIVDDERGTWGQNVYGVPVIGGTDRIASLHAERAFDAAIITIGGSIPARVKLRRLCESLGVPLANAIDPSARLLTGVTIGKGNIIAAFCHFGNGTVIGDNNVFSAHCSFDHHNVLGSEITTGPACATSGLVHVGNRVKMGMGVQIEPKVHVGDDAQIASGAVIITSVPAAHAVKTRVVTTAVVPVRPV